MGFRVSEKMKAELLKQKMQHEADMDKMYHCCRYCRWYCRFGCGGCCNKELLDMVEYTTECTEDIICIFNPDEFYCSNFE